MIKGTFEKMPCKGVVTPQQGLNPRRPFDHQRDAMRALDAMNRLSSFSTMVVLPTGGGKTFTASNWLLKNAINKRRKVLWIAHRHMLLDQAAESFAKYSYADLTPDIGSFSYRIVSGLAAHGRAADIRPDDDLLIASKDSLRSTPEKVKSWLAGEREVFLVVDEAHHATAKTYRTLIDLIKGYVPHVKIIGLTATPFRTLEAEKGLLSTIFKDGIIDGRVVQGQSGIAFQIGLQDLIGRQILSRPVMDMYETRELYGDTLGAKELEAMQRLDSIPEKIAQQMVDSRNRNKLIVQTYVNDAEKYGKTILFAVNIQHAVTLKELFDRAGVKSDIVVSQLKDDDTGRMRKQSENEAAIAGYRDGDIDVLINVNILTEGVDLPSTQSVFLTRPTASSILMTQMIGRALRGVKSGGTAESHIVSFVDDWDERVAWVNPETLFAGNNKFNSADPKEQEREDVRAIALSKIREFAAILDASVDTTALEHIPFIERIPLGMYVFTYTERGDEEKGEEGSDISCQVMVYSSTEAAYKSYIDSLPKLVSDFGLNDEEFAPDSTLAAMVQASRRAHFRDSMVPPFRDKDIESILKYFLQFGAAPTFYAFDTIDRNRLDVDAIARHIVEQDMNRSQETEYENRLWDEGEDNLLRLFFGHKRNYIHAVDTAIRKLTNPEQYGAVSLPMPSDFAVDGTMAGSQGMPKELATDKGNGVVYRTIEQLHPSEEVLEGFDRYIPAGFALNELTGMPVKKFGPYARLLEEDGCTVLYSYGYRVAEHGDFGLRLLAYEIDGESHGWRKSRHALSHIGDFAASRLGLPAAPTLDEFIAMAGDSSARVREVEVVVGGGSEPESGSQSSNAEKPVILPPTSRNSASRISETWETALRALSVHEQPESTEPRSVISREEYENLEHLRPTGLVNERANRPYKSFNGKARILKKGSYEYLYNEARVKLARWSSKDGLVLYEYEGSGLYGGWATQANAPYSRDFATRKFMSLGLLERASGLRTIQLRHMADEPDSMVRIERSSDREELIQAIDEELAQAGSGAKKLAEKAEGAVSPAAAKAVIADIDRIMVHDGAKTTTLRHASIVCIHAKNGRECEVFDWRGRPYRLTDRFTDVSKRFEKAGFLLINKNCVVRPSAITEVRLGAINEAVIQGLNRCEFLTDAAVSLLKERRPSLFDGKGGQ